MQFDQASEIYVRENKHAQRLVSKIMRWNGDHTMHQNALKLSMSMGCARNFQSRYGLPFKKINAGSGRIKRTRRTEAYIELRKLGWAMVDIATVFQVSRQAVEDGIRREAVRKKRTIK